MAKASPLQLAQTPRARPRAAASGQTTRMIAGEAGSRSAAPMPVQARPAMSTPISGVKAQTSEPAVITAAPIMKPRRLPCRSAIRPPLSSSTV